MSSLSNLCLLGLFATSFACAGSTAISSAPALATSAGPATAPQARNSEDETNSISLVIGRNEYNDDWNPVEHINSIGLEGTIGPGEGWEFEWDVDHGSDSGNLTTSRGIFLPTTTRVDAEHTRLTLGGRHTWKMEKFSPYVGTGLEAMHVRLEAFGGTDRSNTAALYLHGGVRYDVTPDGRWYVGLDLRLGGLLGTHNVDPGGVSTDLDTEYIRAAGLVGMRF